MNGIIKLSDNNTLIDDDFAKQIIAYEKALKELKAKYDDIKTKLLAEMEANNILKVDSDILTVSYIASTDRETFDSKKLREDMPDIYDEYVKITTVKPSVRIKVKGL